MPYQAEVSRVNPSSFLFLIDRSGSMSDPFSGGAEGKNKADGVADAINRLIQSLVIKCAKSEGVRDYYYVGVIGYGAEVGPAFSGPLAGQELVPISQVADQPARVEERTKKVDDGAGGLVDQTIKFPIWFDPVAHGPTPMCQALDRAQQVMSGWVAQHPDSYPPIVINISDGEATDGDPRPHAETLRQLATRDGNLLLFNCHLSGSAGTPILFPESAAGLPDPHAEQLFEMSSVLPSRLREAAQAEGYAVGGQPRGFAFNADLVELIRFLDIGTRPSNLDARAQTSTPDTATQASTPDSVTQPSSPDTTTQPSDPEVVTQPSSGR
jgi:hypothetical protein